MKDKYILDLLTLSGYPPRHHQTSSASSFCPQHLAENYYAQRGYSLLLEVVLST